MRTRFAIILVTFNIAVLASAFIYFNRYWRGQVDAERASSRSELAVWQARATAASARPAPAVVVQTNAFKWDQVESTDYRKYIANLRAIGCPEPTVRDIIMTDVMRLYAQRRGQFYQNGKSFKFWETDDKRALKQTQITSREKQLAQIDKELPAVLRELLGINYEREMNKYFIDTDEDNHRLAFLSDAKRDRLAAVRDKYEGEREKLFYNLAPGTALSPLELAELQKIDQERDAALGEVLTPDEKDQYLLTMSPTADALRKQLVGFNPTEQEFREMFKRQSAIDAKYAYADMTDPAVRSEKAAGEQSMMSDIKGEMAPDRAAALDHTHDADYQSLAELTERYDLPAETSQAIVDMRNTAEQQRQELLSNINIPPERVAAALKAIEAETERAARETLGDQAYGQYSQNAPWIRNLASGN